MTQTQIDQTRVIAEWDGWEYIEPAAFRRNGYTLHASELQYLTDLNSLHPVAMDVMDKLTELFNDTMDGEVFMPVSDLEYNIKRSCYIRPINGEYIDLFNAVYEGIVYLNSTKTK
jgi:hypothetical protein